MNKWGGEKMSRKTIYIIGSNVTFNELLASVFETEMKLFCFVYSRESNCRAETESSLTRSVDVILLDSNDFDPSVPIPWFKLPAGVGRTKPRLIFFNTLEDKKVEKLALKNGAAGIFYRHSPKEVILKGVKRVIKGEYWFSRSTLEDFCKNNGFIGKNTQNLMEPVLTARENTILHQVLRGERFKQIAAELGISVNTIKTHTQNIYRKINVNSRQQAVRWFQNKMSTKRPADVSQNQSHPIY
jgi:DNA-binding NarL/FixJ family response regulator